MDRACSEQEHLAECGPCTCGIHARRRCVEQPVSEHLTPFLRFLVGLRLVVTSVLVGFTHTLNRATSSDRRPCSADMRFAAKAKIAEVRRRI